MVENVTCRIRSGPFLVDQTNIDGAKVFVTVFLIKLTSVV